MVTEFISSFVSGDLIPAVILWRSKSGCIFVIDGSHRLSTLVAWINNDFGDGPISKQFYDGLIPEEQIELAEKCRSRVRKKIGLYSDYMLATTNPEKVEPDIVKRSKNLGSLGITLQWIPGGADAAENSFFKINQRAVKINPTELVLLKSRKKPNCIASRAIIRGGKGHKYWDIFPEENQTSLQALADEIHEILFSPKLDTPIKTLDIPLCGKRFSSQILQLVLEFVNTVNKIQGNFEENLEDDLDGSKTIQYLTQVRRISRIINSNHVSSLGLHPIVYFYSKDGRHKIASFSACVSFVQELEEKKKLPDFISIRPNFEKMLIEYDYLIQQINRFYRSSSNSAPHIKNFYWKVMDKLLEDKSVEESIKEIVQHEDFNYLALQLPSPSSSSHDFNGSKKSAAYIRDALNSASKCKICNGLLHRNSITIDHIQRKKDGGTATINNAQLAHPYCNTGIKN